MRYGPEAWVRYSPPFFGWAFAAALPEVRATVLRGLRRIHGRRSFAREARDVADVFATFASSLTDSFAAGVRAGAVVRRRNEGEEQYLRAAGGGRGRVMVTAHTAGWDLAGRLLARTKQLDVLLVMQPEANAEARALSDAARAQAGVRVVHAGGDPLASLELLRHLRRGGVVALQLDRLVPGMRARRVSFLGAPWRVPEGALSLAALTGAPILPVFSRRLGFLDYELVVEPAERLPRRPTEAELDAVAQALAAALERFVRAHPTQWFRFREEP
ncbi:MAG: lysophospholipid acyltransferase family protein [Myxococcales bacterium]|nr:lysophospholipid acyltransferase family protein [Myxococcales bacterium]